MLSALHLKMINLKFSIELWVIVSATLDYVDIQ